MKTKNFLLLLIIFTSAMMYTYAQSAATVNGSAPTKTYDVRLLKHYSVNELIEMETLYPQDYKIFSYFLTESYSIESIDCSDCTKIDIATFDISDYEYLRKKDETVVYEDPKHGFRLTVYSMQSLRYLTPQQEYLLNH
jgi:hypothetical protein